MRLAVTLAKGMHRHRERCLVADESRWTRTTNILIEAPIATPSVPIISSSPSSLSSSGFSIRYRSMWYTGNGPGYTFTSVKVGERVLTCFDACEICGAKGYFEDGRSVVCRNCASPIPRSTLGRSGGCNPIPLPHATESSGALTITERDVRAILPHLRGR